VGNENPFRDSSIGVRFFSASVLDPEGGERGRDGEGRREGPRDRGHGTHSIHTSLHFLIVFQVDKILGFVEELVVENDPEFEW